MTAPTHLADLVASGEDVRIAAWRHMAENARNSTVREARDLIADLEKLVRNLEGWDLEAPFGWSVRNMATAVAELADGIAAARAFSEVIRQR